MKRLISLLVIVTLLLTPTLVLSDSEVVEIEETFTDLKKGDIVRVTFEYGDLTEEDMELDGFELLGYENGEYVFEVLRDMDTGYIKLAYEVKKGEKEEELESGETEDIGEVGEGEGTVINWNQFELGKHGWDFGTHIQYAIRIDAQNYQKYDEIYIIDKSTGLDSADNITVSKLEPNEFGQVVNSGLADYEILENSKGKLYIKLKVDKLKDNQELRYDISYNMTPLEVKYDNEYKIVSKSEYEEIIGKGEGAGETRPEEPVEETPEEPIEETPEEPVEEEPKNETEPEEPIENPEEKGEPKPTEPKEEDKKEPEEKEEDKPIKEDEEEPIEEEKPVEEEDVEEKEEEKPVKKDRPRRKRPKRDKDPVEPEENKPTIPKEEPEVEEEEEPEIVEEIIEEDTDEEEPIIIEPQEDEQIEIVDAEPTPEVEEEIKEVENVQTKPELYSDDVLPQTGESKFKLSYLAGLILIAVGLFIRRK